MTEPEDLLGSDPRPLFFGVDPSRLEPPQQRRPVSVRTWARSLSGMQKEAVVFEAASGLAWRLASDEGPYLAGFDAAPCPLSFLTTGMVSSFMNEITARAPAMGVDTENIRLTLDNHYSMEGSALAGTMTGGALPPELTVELPVGENEHAAQAVVAEAAAASPIAGLMHGVHESRFSLHLNGSALPVGRVRGLDAAVETSQDVYPETVIAEPQTATPLIDKLKPADEVEGVPGGVNTSLAENQKRLLHVRGVCTVRPDGVKEIVQNLFRPIGSEWRFLSDEAPGIGGRGLAPSAAVYMAAGIAFCFMTQFGRYAKIVKRELDGYRIVQDLHLSPGTGSSPAAADPVETHVDLESGEDADFAREILDMSEQTCFLHAFCRTDLEPKVNVVATVRR